MEVEFAGTGQADGPGLTARGIEETSRFVSRSPVVEGRFGGGSRVDCGVCRGFEEENQLDHDDDWAACCGCGMLGASWFWVESTPCGLGALFPAARA